MRGRGEEAALGGVGRIVRLRVSGVWRGGDAARVVGARYWRRGGYGDFSKGVWRLRGRDSDGSNEGRFLTVQDGGEGRMRRPMPDFERRVRNLDHALWRVNFLASILQTHRSLTPRDAPWRAQEAEYVERLAWAERELERWRSMKKGDPHARSRTPPLPLGQPQVQADDEPQGRATRAQGHARSQGRAMNSA